MKSIAVCIKIQKEILFEKSTMWKQVPLSYLDICVLNLANHLETVLNVKINIYIMGPMSQLNYISKLADYGFNRVTLVSDEKIAGADTLGTAKILEKVLRISNETIVLMGGRSDDSATGQVPIQVAGKIKFDLYNFSSLDNIKDIIIGHNYNKGIVVTVNKNVDEQYPSLERLMDSNCKIIVLNGEELNGIPFPIKYTEVISVSKKDIYKKKRCTIDQQAGLEMINLLIKSNGKHRYE